MPSFKITHSGFVWMKLCLSFLIIHVVTYGQISKKASIWYFGDQAGLDFSAGHPVALTNSAMRAFEGSAVACDLAGNLLFYTNGGSMPYPGGIWNRNHQLMPNGDLSNSGSCGSSFQSSIILQHPRHAHLYYLFSTDCMENYSVGGLRYSVIDMTLDGGLGDVITKGVPLVAPVDESLTAVRHANEKDYWIITHKLHTDSFFVYQLTGNGIIGPLKTKIGPVTPDYAGTLKASGNGQKLVYAGRTFSALFDFNSETGQISNYIDLGIAGYSASFSPNCQLLYIADGTGRKLYQFDLLRPNIPATAVQVGTTSSIGFGDMQIGPDDRIYVARFVSSSYLGVIMRPNIRGEGCGYVDDGIYLAGKMGKGGLPNFPNDILGECVSYPIENVSRYDYLYFKETVSSGSSHSGAEQDKPAGKELPAGASAPQNTGNNHLPDHPEHMPAWDDVSYTELLNQALSATESVLPHNQPTFDFQNAGTPKADLHTLPDNISSSQNTTLVLHPIPAKQFVYARFESNQWSFPVTLLLSDASGKVVRRYTHSISATGDAIPLTLDGLSNGMYYLTAVSENHFSTARFILLP
ncbi:MAG: hypothetical protein KatS3mg031_2137 [Chitinophagales bacterium]|nr:MAG: hypothetical protein KatS3mg031_2137 [Chitinophagales bacterium]